MRIPVLAALALCASALLPGSSAKAEVYYPWCAYYDFSTYNCGFTSQRQCLATISGAGGWCRRNPLPPSQYRRRSDSGPVQPGAEIYGVRPPRAGEPARMVQLPNGRWVSNYSCYTDEGYGRYRECNAADHH